MKNIDEKVYKTQISAIFGISAFFPPKKTGKCQRESRVLNSTKAHLKVNLHQWKSFLTTGNLKIIAIHWKTNFTVKTC